MALAATWNSACGSLPKINLMKIESRIPELARCLKAEHDLRVWALVARNCSQMMFYKENGYGFSNVARKANVQSHLDKARMQLEKLDKVYANEKHGVKPFPSDWPQAWRFKAGCEICKGNGVMTIRGDDEPCHCARQKIDREVTTQFDMMLGKVGRGERKST